MKREDCKYYICPACESDGELVERGCDSSPARPLLKCGKCGETYPIEGGIPRFIKTDKYASSFGMQWNLNRRTQLDSYTGATISRDRLRESTRWPRQMAGQRILEAGSGAGRFTETLLDTGAEVFSFDLSSAVDANMRNNGHNENLHLFQGDIFHIPLKKASFDKVLCLGMIQHTPDPERAFRCLVEYIRPGGEIVIDVYTKSLRHLLQWKYLLRPLTKRMDEERLYRIVSAWTKRLYPMGLLLRRSLGGLGRRLMPVVAHSFSDLSEEANLEWSILDTFDMYSPAHDHPQTIATVLHWFFEAGLRDVTVEYGLNGIVGRGAKPT